MIKKAIKIFIGWLFVLLLTQCYFSEFSDSETQTVFSTTDKECIVFESGFVSCG